MSGTHVAQYLFILKTCARICSLWWWVLLTCFWNSFTSCIDIYIDIDIDIDIVRLSCVDRVQVIIHHNQAITALITLGIHLTGTDWWGSEWLTVRWSFAGSCLSVCLWVAPQFCYHSIQITVNGGVRQLLRLMSAFQFRISRILGAAILTRFLGWHMSLPKWFRSILNWV